MVEASVRYVRVCTGVRIPISAKSAKIKSKVFLELAVPTATYLSTAIILSETDWTGFSVR